MNLKLILISITLSIAAHGLVLSSGLFFLKSDLATTFSKKKSGFNVSIREVKKKRIKTKKKIVRNVVINKNNASTMQSIKSDSASTPSQVLYQPTPKYPYKSREYYEEGSVLIKVTIDRGGKAIKAIVLKSSEYERLDNAAIDAALRAKYSSSKVNGVSTGGEHELEFKFELNE